MTAVPFSATLFEPLKLYLEALHKYIDSHTHGSSMGPTTPPLVPSSSLKSAIAAIKSTVVSLFK